MKVSSTFRIVVYQLTPPDIPRETRLSIATIHIRRNVSRTLIALIMIFTLVLLPSCYFHLSPYYPFPCDTVDKK